MDQREGNNKRKEVKVGQEKKIKKLRKNQDFRMKNED